MLATVTAGLYQLERPPADQRSTTRLQGIFFWDFFIYLIEGMIFLITGLQARTLIDRIGDFSISTWFFPRCFSAVVITPVSSGFIPQPIFPAG